MADAPEPLDPIRLDTIAESAAHTAILIHLVAKLAAQGRDRTAADEWLSSFKTQVEGLINGIGPVSLTAEDRNTLNRAMLRYARNVIDAVSFPE